MLVSCGVLLLAQVFRLLLAVDARFRVSRTARTLWRAHVLKEPPPLLEYLCSAPGGIISLTNRQLLYRVLRTSEVPEVAQQGLRALAPAAARSIVEHVRDGSKPGYQDQFISASSDLAVSRLWAGVFRPLAVIRIHTQPTIIDISSQAAQQQVLVEQGAMLLRESTHADRSSEVLLCEVHPRDVVVCQSRVLVEMMWPAAGELQKWTGSAVSATLRRYEAERVLRFPTPIAGELGAFTVHSNVGRFVHVTHIASERHYLAFSGAPNIHWSSTFRQPLATPRQLVVQCQAEVTAMLLHRMLFDQEPEQEPLAAAESGVVEFPLCALYLCKVTHEVSRLNLDEVIERAEFPIPDGLVTPLLLYEFNPADEPLSASDPSSLQHVQSSMRHSLFLDALLDNLAPGCSDVFLRRGEAGHIYLRYDLQFVLDNRPDAADQLDLPTFGSSPDGRRDLILTLQQLLAIPNSPHAPGKLMREHVPHMMSLLRQLDALKRDLEMLSAAYSECRSAEAKVQIAQIHAELKSEKARQRRGGGRQQPVAASEPPLLLARVPQLRELLSVAHAQEHLPLQHLLTSARALGSQPPAYVAEAKD